MSGRRLQAAAIVLGIIALAIVLASATLIDRRAPTVERISLSRSAGSDRVALTHSTIDVQFSEPVQRRSAEARFRLQPPVEGSLSWDGDRTLIFTPDPKFPVESEFEVVIERGFTDLPGNVNETATDPFAFRTVGLPALASSEPADGATSVALDDPIRLTFDRLMDTQRTESALRVQPSAPVEVSWAGATLVVTPTGSLAPGTRYRIEIGDQAADTDGNRLVRPVSVAFTTVSLGLGVSRVLPATGSGGVPLSGPIGVVFDTPIDSESISGAITLTPAASGQVRAVPLPEDAGGVTTGTSRVLEFVPDAPLAAHTTYVAELRGGVVRAQGTSSSASGRTWTFTTGSAPELLQNQVTFLSARGGFQNLWAMNPDGSNTRQLTGEIAPVTSYDVSGDGRTVVYAAAGVVKTLALPSGRATTLTGADFAEYVPRLLPDASAVIVGRRQRATGRDLGYWVLPLRDDAPPARLLLPSGAPPLGSSAQPESLPSATGTPSPWTTFTALSADGLHAMLKTDSGQIVRAALDATTVPQAVGLRDPAGPAMWSTARNGFLVAAERTLDGARGSWIVPLTGAPTSGPAGVSWPAISGAGATVAIGGDPLQVLEYRGSWFAPPLRLTFSSDLVDRQPSFSPGGDVAIFVRVNRATPDRSVGVWRVNIDGTGLSQLSPDGSDPRWLP